MSTTATTFQPAPWCFLIHGTLASIPFYPNLTPIHQIRAVLRDESVYPDAGNFDPDRYLTKEGKLDPSVRDPEAAFGYGRRIW